MSARVDLVLMKLASITEHGIVDAGGVANELVRFRVVLKPSHVDKKQHGLVSMLYYVCSKQYFSNLIMLF